MCCCIINNIIILGDFIPFKNFPSNSGNSSSNIFVAFLELLTIDELYESGRPSKTDLNAA